MKKVPNKNKYHQGFPKTVLENITELTIDFHQLIDCVAELQELEKQRCGIQQLAKNTYTINELRSIYQKHEYTQPVMTTDSFIDWLEANEK